MAIVTSPRMPVVSLPPIQVACLEGMAILVRFCRFPGYAKPLLIADDQRGHLATSLDFGESRH